MSIKDVYCLAYAPVQGTCLLDLQKDDICPDLLTKELGFLEKFTATSFQGFKKYFDKADLASSEAAAALFCLSAFCTRLQTISLRARTLAGELLQGKSSDYRELLQKLSAEAKKNGLPPEDGRIEDLFDTEKDAEWEEPCTSKGKVEFRHSISMIAHEDEEAGDSNIEEKPKAEFTRKKVRKATGYAKFNFSVTDAQDGNKSEDDSEASSEQRQHSQSKKPNEESQPAVGTSNSTSRAANDTLPLLCFCCRPESPEDVSHELLRRSSYVSMGSVQEIQDKDADVHWHDSERHSGRFTRIRGRIPTGHVSVMKSNSEEMLDKLLAEDTEEGRSTRELLIRNTELNSATPPFSPRPSSADRLNVSPAYSEGGQVNEPPKWATLGVLMMESGYAPS